MCFLDDMHRSANFQPVSGVLSSQVAAISNTSSQFAVWLTFKYSNEVSSFMHSTHVTTYGNKLEQ